MNESGKSEIGKSRKNQVGGERNRTTRDCKETLEIFYCNNVNRVPKFLSELMSLKSRSFFNTLLNCFPMSIRNTLSLSTKYSSHLLFLKSIYCLHKQFKNYPFTGVFLFVYFAGYYMILLLKQCLYCVILVYWLYPQAVVQQEISAADVS